MRLSVATKGRSCATLNRPLQLLYPLEINQPPDTKINSPGTLNPPGTTEQKDASGGADQSDAPEKSRRPQRASAKKARLNITVQKWRDIVSDQKQKCQTHVCECQSIISEVIYISLTVSPLTLLLG